MKHTRAALLFAAFVLVFSACDLESDAMRNFAPRLHGTWVTNNPAGLGYTEGSLVISFNTITIHGYTRENTDNPARFVPFDGLPRGVPLSGYSEDGNLVISVPGVLQYRVPYGFFTPGWNDPDVLFLMFAADFREILERRTTRE